MTAAQRYRAKTPGPLPRDAAPDIAAQSAQPTTTGQSADTADYAGIAAVGWPEDGNVVQGRRARPAGLSSTARDATLEPRAESGEVRTRRIADGAP